MAYVAIDQVKAGNKINVMVRGSPVEAAVVSLPFYARKR
jgi:glycine cleavage system aminomethyltransferase T